MRPRRYRRGSSDPNTILLVTVGAMAGAAAGLYLGRRYGSVGEALDDLRVRFGKLQEFWLAADELEDDDGPVAVDDDDSEDEIVDDGTAVEDADDDETVIAAARYAGRALAERVLDALERNRLLRRRAVDISAVGDGVVELTGWVRESDEATLAAAITREVPGVNMVLNRIRVRDGSEESEAASNGEPSRDAGVVDPTTPGSEGTTR